ncbi:MAG TPA: Hsp70 family protein, partial [Acidimicrobiales bacterium]|nr:Hsp70 family protein [Acidimicrobiales bacterium]
MTTYLGIDLGTTYTAAAVHDGAPGRGAEVVTLGDRGPTVPSVLYLRPDGGFLAGDAAERRAVTEPERIARQFKRRLGDPTPLVLGGTPHAVEELTAALLAWVVETVAARARGGGEAPAAIVLTHPANWGPFKRDLLRTAADTAGLRGALLVTEPQAAAIAYSAQSRVEPGAVVAVYDLGGGTFDAAVLRKEGDGGFTVLGTPDGIEHLGGIDIDAAIFAHVVGTVGDAYQRLDPEDAGALAAVARLRVECTQAKEALSGDTEVAIPVLLPTVQTEVRMTRGELEALVRPTLAETVTALQRALRSADVAAEKVDHVLLVGGSSRMPLVAELVSTGLGRPVAVDAHPKHAVPLGAALLAAHTTAAAAVSANGNGHRPPPPPPPPTPAAQAHPTTPLPTTPTPQPAWSPPPPAWAPPPPPPPPPPAWTPPPAGAAAPPPPPPPPPPTDASSWARPAPP